MDFVNAGVVGKPIKERDLFPGIMAEAEEKNMLNMNARIAAGFLLLGHILSREFFALLIVEMGLEKNSLAAKTRCITGLKCPAKIAVSLCKSLPPICKEKGLAIALKNAGKKHSKKSWLQQNEQLTGGESSPQELETEASVLFVASLLSRRFTI